MRAIDADALEKILEKIPAADIKNMGGQAYVLVKLSQVFNVIDNQPTIEPERKKGTWIEQDDSWDGVYYECSACGEPWTLIDGTPWDNGMKFCPNCGAEMRDDDGE